MPACFVRRAALLVGLLALAACEDNPDQFFKTAPKGAGQIWNNGNSKPYSDAARNSFDDNFNNVSKDSLCSAPQKHDVWSRMVNEKIVPSSAHGITVGGINLSGDNWSGLKFKDAQAKLCQANPLGVDETELSAAWGDSNEVQVSYLINNSTVDFLQLNQGYRGTLEFDSRKTAYPDTTKDNPLGHHHYTIGVGTQILRDGKEMTLDWGNNGKNFAPQATELFDALMATFAPEMKSTQDNCAAIQACLAHPVDGGAGAFGVRPLGIYFQVPVVTQQPQASTPSIIYAYPVKLMPFSGASMMLKLDEEGPVATTTGLGDRNDKTCVQKLGQTYGDFLGTCVNVSDSATQNQGVLGKLFGGFGHDKESYNFTVQGVDTDFASGAIGEDKIVGDNDRPVAADTSFHFNIDIRATGQMMNEYAEDGTTFTFGATGAIYREFARRVQADINVQQAAFMKSKGQTFTAHELGDPACLMPVGADLAKWAVPDMKNPPWAAGCTGFEQFITPAEHTTQSVSAGVRSVSVGGPRGSDMGFLSALKPGDPISMFCADPSPNPDGADAGASCNQDSDCWSLSCAAPDGADATAAASGKVCGEVTDTFFKHCGKDDAIGQQGTIFDTAFHRVITYLGRGDANGIAPALRDRKYYLTQFGYALVKYLMTAGLSPRPTDLNLPMYGPTGTACNGRTCEPNPDHLQFDQNGQGSDAMTLNYIDRRWVDHGKDPISFQYQILVNSGNQQETRFRQHLDRDERGLFTAMQSDRSKALLDESNNLRLTNLIGSQIITDRWKDSGVAGKDAYYCATHLDNACTKKSAANKPPMVGAEIELDDKGQPLMTDYKGAFTGTPFSLKTNNIQLVKYDPNNEAAQVQLPNWKDPYSKAAGLLPDPGPKVLPNWRPLAPGAGFPIPVNGERDRFIPAAAIDFSGQNLSMNLDYNEDPKDHSFTIIASEASVFEGEIFLCDDPVTHEILHVRQYDSIAEIQDWMSRHTGVQDACDMFIRTTPAGSGSALGEPAQLLAKKAGITATVGQGSGVGRIIDVLVYDASQ